MLKKKIEYTDYNGVEREETFYFNLTKAELAEMELTTSGGFTSLMEQIIESKDVPTLIKTFKEIILKSYGKKSDDGTRFIKSEELSTAFSQTEAFSNLYMELVFDEGAAASFVNGIVPAELSQKANTKGIDQNHPALKN